MPKSSVLSDDIQIAVCNKLIKQAYGVCKNDLVYDENYRRRKVEV
ncbi:MAG: hypothetical protein ACI9XB_005323 [Gammaproteobacteria bacterium]|jgi:hypothetical protein